MIKVGIVGGTGYTGVELLRILALHPDVALKTITSRGEAGTAVSELFPNHLRGLAISLAGLVNSGVSFTVQLVFPWELANLGNSATFLLFAVFAAIGLGIVGRILPETSGRSLEELESLLVKT